MANIILDEIIDQGPSVKFSDIGNYSGCGWGGWGGQAVESDEFQNCQKCFVSAVDVAV